eukprot:4848901-Prymnesium_polylepis.1
MQSYAQIKPRDPDAEPRSDQTESRGCKATLRSDPGSHGCRATLRSDREPRMQSPAQIRQR